MILCWDTNKFTNHSTVYADGGKPIDLFGKNVMEQMAGLATVVNDYGESHIDKIKTQKSNLMLGPIFNQLMRQTYNFSKKIEFEEI